jgi:F-type H+-transporting ATPase subunit delta
MLPERIAQRYAKSLFELAAEKNAAEAVKADFDVLESVYDRTPDFRFFLRGPDVQPRVRARILRRLFEGRLHEITAAFLELLASRSRVELLPQIAYAFLELYHQSRNEVVVRLISAHPMTEELKSRIAERVRLGLNKTPLLKEEVNPELIGGFKLLIGTRLYDQTVAYALRRIEKDFSTI